MSACPQDEKLVDLVYDELAGAELAALERHVESCEACGAELARLSGTRQVFSGLADRDPPAAVRASILEQAASASHVRAAQAEAAPKAAAAPGLWSRFVDRWLRPAMAHPALAAAATLVLILGVAGALRWQGGTMAVERIAQPAAPSADELAEPSAAVADSIDDEAEAVSEYASPSQEAQEQPKAAEVDEDSLGAVASEPPRPQPPRRASRPREAQGGGAGQLEMRRESAADVASGAGDAFEGTAQRSRATAGRAARGAPAPAEREVAAPERRFAEPPPPQPEPTPPAAESATRDRAAPAAPPAATDDADAEQAPSPEDAREAWLREMTERLAAAARAERCGEAAALANDLRERAPAYYRERLEGAGVLAPCRDAIEAERQRRSR
jgi:hypothetical protein